MDCLFVSHTGMTEPLGRSQVLPYLLGLAARGVSIRVLSHEPSGTAPGAIESTRATIEAGGLSWIPLVRSPSHQLVTKVWESSRAVLLGLAEALRGRPRIVHARSYLPAAVADVIASLAPSAKMLFDCRGMLGDEYVDAGYWTRDRIEYRLLKRFERRAFHRAEGMVVLTEALRRWLHETRAVSSSVDIEVVPCCVEAERFVGDEAARTSARTELGISEDRLVLVYSGSLGTWYQETEMARFAGTLKRLHPNLLWLVLTRSDATSLRAAAAREGVEVICRAAVPDDMPRLLPAGDLGLSFIQPCFSKMGSSPTKVAEYLASGLPVVVNAGIGDQEDLAVENDACVLLSTYGEDDLAAAALRVSELARRPFGERCVATRRVVRDRFSLTHLGVPRYEALYQRLMRA